MSSVFQLRVMTRRCVIFLLISGWCHVHTDYIIRRFHAIDQKETWAKAQSYCRDTFNDLATILDQTNNADAQQVAGNGKFWIGLYHTSWKWSQDDKDAQLDNSFTGWASNEPGDGKCVTISALGIWSVSDCGAQSFFTCYSAAGEHHILEKQLMTWSDARTFCRSTYSDLSSIKTQQENQDVSRLLQNVTGGAHEKESDEGSGGGVSVPMAWIGLYRDFWKWSDQSSAPYSQWAIKQPDESKDCVVMDVKSSSADWFSRSCSEKHDFLCHSDIRASVLRSVTVRLSSGSTDVNDPTLQDAILRQLKEKLEEGGISEEVKLRWRDNVFHREESAPPGDCEEKCV
ncbi:macrophage mannose receptor 1-like isoform X1 [Hippoglossus hippoglossus]|uniref:macrophage mannose receptor 1-like isoform X1 n=2 Tax=Hippoglossus hippoglossus TaxID=8267 RepID=UPI00148CFD99|nr:macrophage mannose receptor 1-like isoform X1 [Hippoglossus hippoglossus]